MYCGKQVSGRGPGRARWKQIRCGVNIWAGPQQLDEGEKHHASVESAVSVRGQSRTKHSQKNKQRQRDLRRCQESARFAELDTAVTITYLPQHLLPPKVRVEDA